MDQGRNFMEDKHTRTYQPLVVALLSMGGFLATITVIYLVRYGKFMDKGLLQYYLAFGLIGALSLGVRLYGFGVTFLSGVTLGLVIDCLVSYLEGPRPTMSGGIYNMLIVFLGVACGVVVEVSSRRTKNRAA